MGDTIQHLAEANCKGESQIKLHCSKSVVVKWLFSRPHIELQLFMLLRGQFPV